MTSATIAAARTGRFRATADSAMGRIAGGLISGARPRQRYAETELRRILQPTKPSPRIAADARSRALAGASGISSPGFGQTCDRLNPPALTVPEPVIEALLSVVSDVVTSQCSSYVSTVLVGAMSTLTVPSANVASIVKSAVVVCATKCQSTVPEAG